MAKSEEKKIPVSRKAPEGYAFAQRNAIGLDESRLVHTSLSYSRNVDGCGPHERTTAHISN